MFWMIGCKCEAPTTTQEWDQDAALAELHSLFKMDGSEFLDMFEIPNSTEWLPQSVVDDYEGKEIDSSNLILRIRRQERRQREEFMKLYGRESTVVFDRKTGEVKSGGIARQNVLEQYREAAVWQKKDEETGPDFPYAIDEARLYRNELAFAQEFTAAMIAAGEIDEAGELWDNE